MNILQPIGEQLFLAFYQLTSLRVGNTDLAQLGLDFQDFFLNSEMVFFLKIVSVIVSVGIAIAGILIFNKLHELNHKIATLQVVPPSEPAMGGPVQNRWNEIVKHIESVREGEWKFAIIEADKLVDDQLKLRFAGETMGERLMNIDKTQLVTIDGLWEAHKIRNRLAHDTDYFLRHAEAARAIKLFEQTLKELEVIQ